MTPVQRAEIKQQLQALQQELTENGVARIEPNRTDDAKVGDDEDEQPLNEMLQSIASNRNKAHGGMLAQVNRALNRLEADPEAFGECAECGEDIPLGRLKAMPYAECCVECQSLRDGPRGSSSRKKLTDYR